jgi:hypothetical protein
MAKHLISSNKKKFFQDSLVNLYGFVFITTLIPIFNHSGGKGWGWLLPLGKVISWPEFVIAKTGDSLLRHSSQMIMFTIHVPEQEADMCSVQTWTCHLISILF